LPRSLAGPVVTRIPTSHRVVALTFDGGAGAQGAAKILAVLRDQGVRASFFVTGQFASTNPGLTAGMAERGPVGNHSWDHPHFPILSAAATTSQLTRTRSAILGATARDPKPFFRFPFGDYDPRSLGRVHAAGYGAVGWTTDSLGWKGTSGGQSVDSVVDRVLRNRTPGQIVLMHVGANPDDHTTLDADALARIIAGYRAAGYGFVTLETLR
jgi:peptidoglycan/xylan/chitin deacetylase (PgdA/CDA1 family)